MRFAVIIWQRVSFWAPMMLSLLCLVVLLITHSVSVSLPPSFPSDVKHLISLSQNTTMGYERLSWWVDSSGPRLSGSSQLESALTLALNRMGDEKIFTRVWSEAATIPKVRTRRCAWSVE